MAFHEVRFPASLSFGSIGGPERRTEVVTLANGFEERNSPWAHSRRRYDAGVGMRSMDDIETLVAFFEARRGELFGFRWKDWSDYKSCLPSETINFADQVIATGDGTTQQFQLGKTYASGLESYLRPIKKPVLGTVSVGVQGGQLSEGIHFTVDYLTGVLIWTTRRKKTRRSLLVLNLTCRCDLRPRKFRHLWRRFKPGMSRRSRLWRCAYDFCGAYSALADRRDEPVPLLENDPRRWCRIWVYRS